MPGETPTLLLQLNLGAILCFSVSLVGSLKVFAVYQTQGTALQLCRLQ
jgi:hypothetical protein